MIQAREFHELTKKSDLKILNKIFQRTPSTQWREVEKVMKKLGADLQEGEGSRVRVSLDDYRIVLHKPHGKSGMDPGALDTIGKFLRKVGVQNNTKHRKF